MHPKEISITDFTYDLPHDKIAFYPLTERDASRLLVYRDGMITESQYRFLDEQLPADSLLVFNNTRVVEARLLFKKETGGVIEIFCLEPASDFRDIACAMQQTGKVTWKCLVGGASKWKRGQLLEKKIATPDHSIVLKAAYLEKGPDYFLIELSWEPLNLSFAEVLHHAGAIPLPPYIKREAAEPDKERYQTIYARAEGSVAAPTAGLHFTDALFEKLRKKNIATTFVTLHVGAGTFKPVKAERMQEHDMHAEFIAVTRDTLEALLRPRKGPLVAVGTTSLRTLESLYWLGAKLLATGTLTEKLEQWEVYDAIHSSVTREEALAALLHWMEENNTETLHASTRIIIAPGYSFKMVDALITNFHQPQSTLLLLVAALIGEEWKKVYSYALENNFRFLSYGDGCLLWRAGSGRILQQG